MHGTSPADTTSGRVVFAPHRRISHGDGSKLRLTPAWLLCLRSNPRCGLSLACSDCPLPDHHYKVKDPDLHLRLPLLRLQRPVRYRLLRSRPASIAASGETNATTRSLDSGSAFRLLRTSTPRQGTLVPCRIKAFGPAKPPENLPSKTARSPVAPRNRFY